MALLINLPLSISGELLGVCLDLKSLVNLDNAFCNHEFRPQILKILESPYCTFSDAVSFGSDISVKWLLVRQLKLSRIEILPEVEHQAIKAYLQSFGKVIRTVSCNNCNEQKTLDMVAFYTHNLASFSLSNVPVKDSINEVLWFNAQLRELHLEQVTELRFSHFDNIQLLYLRQLSLRFSVISDDLLLAVVRGSAQLICIDLQHCEGITDAGLIALAQHCPLLQSVGLCELSVSNQALSDIVKQCPLVAHLNIEGNKVVTDAGILSIARGLSHLHSLVVANCSLLTDLTLLHLSTYTVDTLEKVYLSGLPRVRVGVFISLLQKCTKLHTFSTNLQLHKCYKTIIPHMCNLKSLLLWSIVTDDMLIDIAQHCKKLEVLDITPFFTESSATMTVSNDMMYAATDESIIEAPTYSGKGLLALIHGLPHLRVLGVEEDYATDGRVGQLAQCLWQAFLPRLVITVGSEHFMYDVMKQK